MKTRFRVGATRLIGFDVRSIATEPWSSERVALYLLRDDIECPRSVDQGVWPSVFAETDSDEWRGVLGHWSDLGKMTIAAEKIPIPDRGVCCVATAILWDLLSNETKDDWTRHGLEATVPGTLGPDWNLVGYDVADRWLCSGLSNCGYVRNERAEWRSRWGNQLNMVHLFDDPKDAQSFASETDERVPEHAPFFVYGLFTAPFGTAC